jgi:hypothetical protein
MADQQQHPDGWDPRLLAEARALEARLRAQGIDPFDHNDADVDAILERERDWQGDDWLGDE